jgi:hypothetical protein
LYLLHGQICHDAEVGLTQYIVEYVHSFDGIMDAMRDETHTRMHAIPAHLYNKHCGQGLAAAKGSNVDNTHDTSKQDLAY